MTKHILSFLLIMTLFSPSCVKVLKNVNDYYPQVKTTSVTKNPDGSVTVYGEIISTGNTGIQYCGFCMDTAPNPDMLTNQELASNLNGNVFSCTYSSFNALETYYFRAFAANTDGYAIGAPVSANNLGFDTSQIPCHPTAQYMVLTGAANETDPYTFADSVTQQGTGYEVLAYTDSHTLDIIFNQYPTSGVYESDVSTTFDAIAAKNVTIYVQQISSGVIDITICSASVFVQDMFTGNYYPYVMTTKFRSPS